jgi:hypothetical protein
MPDPILKTCTKCGETKPLEEYYGHASSADGRMFRCKVCHRAAARSRREATRAETNEAKRRYRLENKDAINERRRAYVAANQAKLKARRAVKRAIRNRELIPEPCLFCLAPETEAHHHDYTDQLAVTWLCKPHHALIHRAPEAAFQPPRAPV